MNKTTQTINSALFVAGKERDQAMSNPWILSIRRTVACAALAIGLSVATAQAEETQPEAPTLPAARCIDFDKIRASGPLHEFAKRSYEFQLKSGRTGSDWDNKSIPGDGVGRWMLAMCRLGAYLHEKPQKMFDEIPRMLKMRNKYGVFGPEYPPEVIDGGAWFDANHVVEWAIDYAKYYDPKFGMEFVREFVEASFLAREAVLRPGPRQKGSRWRSWGETSSDFAPIQGMARLAMFMGEEKYNPRPGSDGQAGLSVMAMEMDEEKYKRFVKELAELALEFRAHMVNGHGHATCLLTDAFVHAYEATGEKKFLDFAEKFAAEGLLTAEGSNMAVPDGLGGPSHTEGCAVVDWLRVNLDLGRVTGHAKYFEKAERILWGPYAHHMSFRGGMGCARFGFNATTLFMGETNGCCNMHGANGVAWALTHTVLSDSQGLTLPLYHPFTAKAKLSSGKAVEVNLATTYPDDGAMRYRIEKTESTEAWRLRLRVPAWSKIEDLKINGRPETAKPQDGWLDLTRAWKAGDEISLRIPMTIWFSRPQSDEVLLPPTEPKRDIVLRGVRIFRGPMLLCVEHRANESVMDWDPYRVMPRDWLEAEKLLNRKGLGENPSRPYPSRNIPWGLIQPPLTLCVRADLPLDAAMPKDESAAVLGMYIPELSYPSAHRGVPAAVTMLDPVDGQTPPLGVVPLDVMRQGQEVKLSTPRSKIDPRLKTAILTPMASKWKYVDEKSYWHSARGLSWIILFDVAFLRTPEGLELLTKAQGEKSKP